ncbi:MAG: hypothetical protein IPL74_12800 [Bacteroidetes bacterium]|nr:hypothetical protein [Bacteroidota bacterium]
MEIPQKKKNPIKNFAIFILLCLFVVPVVQLGFKNLFSNHWTPEIEKIIQDKCITGLKTRPFAKGVSNKAITSYCNCTIEKLKSKYKPREVSALSIQDFEAMAKECVYLIKDSSALESQP